MPKVQVDTDRGKYEFELDRVPSSNEEMQKVVNSFFAGQQEKKPFQGQTESGNLDVSRRPILKNPDGTTSTVRSASFRFENQDGTSSEVLLPTVGPNGENWNNQQAIENYRKTGKHLGKFKTPEDANRYAQYLHEQQAKMVDDGHGFAVEAKPGMWQEKKPEMELPEAWGVASEAASKVMDVMPGGSILKGIRGAAKVAGKAVELASYGATTPTASPLPTGAQSLFPTTANRPVAQLSPQVEAARKGASEFAGETAETILQPEMLALPGVVHAAKPFVRFLVSAGFTVPMAQAAYEQGKGAYEAYQRGDTKEAVRLALSSVREGVFTGAGALGMVVEGPRALQSGFESAKPTIAKSSVRVMDSKIKPKKAYTKFGETPSATMVMLNIWDTTMDGLRLKVGEWIKKYVSFVEQNLQSPENAQKQVSLKAALDVVDERMSQARKDNKQTLFTELQNYRNSLTHEIEADPTGKLIPTRPKPASLTPIEVLRLMQDQGSKTRWSPDALEMTLNETRADVYRALNKALDAVVPGTRRQRSIIADLISADKSIESRTQVENRSNLTRVGDIIGGAMGGAAGEALGMLTEAPRGAGAAAGFAATRLLGSTAGKTRLATGLGKLAPKEVEALTKGSRLKPASAAEIPAGGINVPPGQAQNLGGPEFVTEGQLPPPDVRGGQAGLGRPGVPPAPAEAGPGAGGGAAAGEPAGLVEPSRAPELLGNIQSLLGYVKGTITQQGDRKVDFVLENGRKGYYDIVKDELVLDEQAFREQTGRAPTKEDVASGETTVPRNRITGEFVIRINEAYANKASIGHEMGHTIWDLLTEPEQRRFLRKYKTLTKAEEGFADELGKAFQRGERLNPTFQRIVDFFQQWYETIIGPTRSGTVKRALRGEISQRRIPGDTSTPAAFKPPGLLDEFGKRWDAANEAEGVRPQEQKPTYPNASVVPEKAPVEAPPPAQPSTFPRPTVGKVERVERPVPNAYGDALGTPMDSIWDVPDVKPDGSRIRYQLRKKDPPKKTVKAFKLFRVKPKTPGVLYPLYVNPNEQFKPGVWYDADVGPMNSAGKVKSKIGPLAPRPGLHAADRPSVPHIGSKGFRRSNEVWAEIEIPADREWQSSADRNGMNEQGEIVPVNAALKEIPVDGHYRFKTKPEDPGDWYISGAMKIKRILSDAEVQRYGEKTGTPDLPREQPFDFEGYGLNPKKRYQLTKRNPQEETPEFKPSSVVGYRGDSINVSGPLAAKEGGDLGKGIYFAGEKYVASEFTESGNPAHVKAYSLSLKNPFDLRDQNLASNESWKSMMATVTDQRQKSLLERWAGNDLDLKNTYGFLARAFGQTPETFNAFLQKHGFDGVIEQGVRGISDGVPQYVVFNPDQAKPDIRYQLTKRHRAKLEKEIGEEGVNSKVNRKILWVQDQLDQDPRFWQWNPKKKFLEGNDEYLKSIDPDLLCQRSAGTDKAVRMLKDALGPDYEVDMAWEVISRCKEQKLQTPCPQCYVFSARAKGKGMQKKYITGVGGYDGEIFRFGKETISELEKRGLRAFSSTDFKAEHIPGLMSLMLDAHEKNLPIGAYTKQLDFVKVFGNSGAYVNMSIGRDEYIGMNLKDALRARNKYPNVGTVYIAFNDAEVLKALRTAYVDHVIPEHISGQPLKTLKTKVEGEIKDYTGSQSEHMTEKTMKLFPEVVEKYHRMAVEQGKPGLELKPGKNAPPEIKVYDYEHGGNLAKYLKLCKERGLTIKFEEIYSKLGENEKNLYMKLIGPEYGKFKGEYPYKPVRPVFDEKEIPGVLKRRLKTMEKEYPKYVKIAEGILKEKKAGTLVLSGPPKAVKKSDVAMDKPENNAILRGVRGNRK